MLRLLHSFLCMCLQEMTMNEIQVMNQLSHPNILQLYAAFEVKNQVILIVE